MSERMLSVIPGSYMIAKEMKEWILERALERGIMFSYYDTIDWHELGERMYSVLEKWAQEVEEWE